MSFFSNPVGGSNAKTPIIRDWNGVQIFREMIPQVGGSSNLKGAIIREAHVLDRFLKDDRDLDGVLLDFGGEYDVERFKGSRGLGKAFSPRIDFLIFPGANFTGVSLFLGRNGNSRLALPSAHIPKAKFERAVLPGSDLYRANLSNAIMRNCNMGNAKFFGANLQEALMMACKMDHARFVMTNLRDADLSAASLVGANFGFDPLYNALETTPDGSYHQTDQLMWDGHKVSSSEAVNLSNILFARSADMKGAVLDRADLRRARLTGVRIEEWESFEGAKFDGAEVDEDGYAFLQEHGMWGGGIVNIGYTRPREEQGDPYPMRFFIDQNGMKIPVPDDRWSEETQRPLCDRIRQNRMIHMAYYMVGRGYDEGRASDELASLEHRYGHIAG